MEHGTHERFLKDLSDAVAYPFGSLPRSVLALSISVVMYVVLVLSTMPTFSAQMLSDGVGWLGYVVVSLTETTYRSSGLTGVSLVVLYAVLTGVAVVNTVGQIRAVGLSKPKEFVGVVPGLLASGCASCGAGLLGFIGLTGALAAMPYDGTLLRVGGLALLVFFLGRAGHPERCGVTQGGGS
ncbi:MAG: hypothetical protein ACI9QA_000193 [Methanobacteriota archaeon]|jgi:hypothetical protein|uniref:Uncharacterized protein n=1 Tax=Halorutilus salinus TaxID=2487751 RepID=A0A9Q4C4J1_9EURY|nr:hypothetical protein [Halorutilus salinus]MCX2819720.1 hypothetical protein [Halorutilus salinus]